MKHTYPTFSTAEFRERIATLLKGCPPLPGTYEEKIAETRELLTRKPEHPGYNPPKREEAAKS